MGLQKKLENQLTPEQRTILAKLNALRNFTLDPISFKIPNFKLNPGEQISTFDFLKKIIESVLGSVALDIYIKSFLDKLFDPNTDKLEKIVLKAMAKSLDSTEKRISDTQTNEEWLMQHALPPLHAVFIVAKAEIVKKIVTMIFGPKEKMSDDPVVQSILLNSAVCSSDMFSMSNPTSDSDGDFEFNKVELRKRLEKGEMIFVISCQDVKIKLPETIINQANDIIANNANPSKPVINPSIIFEQVSNVVTAEAQRINSPENANAVRKSFAQILVEQIMNLITTAVEPYLPGVLESIQTKSSSNLGLKVSDFSPSPCEVRTMCGSGSESEDFKRKTAFMKALMNAVLAYLLSVILQKLIKEVKKIIKNYILKKAQELIKRKIAKRQFISDEALEKAEKARKFAEAIKSFEDIFKYIESQA